MSSTKPIKHVLGLSGGRDSAALAIYMRQNHPDLNIEYFFTAIIICHLHKLDGAQRT